MKTLNAEHGPRLKILVCDDEPHILELIRNDLQGKGHQVITAQSGREALDKIASEGPDLVMLDADMPEIDGFEVMLAIRENPQTENLGVVLLLVKPSDQAVFDAYDRGADMVLSKPMDSMDLASFF